MRCPPLLAAPLVVALLTVAAAGQAVEPQVQNGVPFVSGGVGSQNQRELRAVQSDYNLHLLFAVKGTGEYLADIPVTIADAKGRVLVEATAEGPFFFARLPAGRYRVTAGSGSAAINRTVRVGNRGTAKESFYWTGTAR